MSLHPILETSYIPTGSEQVTAKINTFFNNIKIR